MNAIKAGVTLFFDPGITLGFKAKELRTESVDEDSWEKGGKARIAYIAQAIVSIVATVFAILATILLPIAALCIEGKETAWDILQGMTWLTLMHASLIPTCFIAAFLKHSWEWGSPTNELTACLTCITPGD